MSAYVAPIPVILQGAEIGYGENLTLLSTVSGLGSDIPGCSLVIPGGSGRPVIIDWGATCYGSAANDIVNLLLYTAPGSGAGIGAYALAQRGQWRSVAANQIGEVHKAMRLPVSDTDRTIKLQYASLIGTANLQGQLQGQSTYLHARWG